MVMPKGYKHSPETLKKLSKAFSGKNNPMYGAHRTGKDNPHWKGGVTINWFGYKMVKNYNHPFRKKNNYVLEHRLVWEEHNKAILLPHIEIHHKNGDKLDNRIENLQVMTVSEHARLGKGIKHNYPNSYIRRGKKYIRKEDTRNFSQI